jgi:Putative peptidoglycan binding domain
MNWRVAKSLLRLREQVNIAAPNRDKSSDGTIGDAAHASRSSDHNPWVTEGGIGVVTAMDISNDPSHKVVSGDIAETLRKSRDSRIKYVISNKRIFSATSRPWEWRPYTGPNPHIAHVHISVNSAKKYYDDVKDWTLPPALGRGDPNKTLTLVDMVSLGDMAHVGESGERVKQIQWALNKAGLPLPADGSFGPITMDAVKKFQAAKNLEADGIVGPATAAELEKYLAPTPPPPVEAPPSPVAEWQSGKGSWFSQFEGQYHWKDRGDAPGSNALGVPDSAQGISFYDGATLGKWFEVEYPNGHKLVEQQTDIGPAPWTGKKIDISAVAAERAGYSPYNFPTGAIIRWHRVDTPAAVARLDPREAAVRYRDLRKAVA